MSIIRIHFWRLYSVFSRLALTFFESILQMAEKARMEQANESKIVSKCTRPLLSKDLVWKRLKFGTSLYCFKDFYFSRIFFFRTFLNSHLFWLNSHPFFAHPIICRLNLSGLWSIKAQLENLPAEVIEVIKEHTLKV